MTDRSNSGDDHLLTALRGLPLRPSELESPSVSGGSLPLGASPESASVQPRINPLIDAAPSRGTTTLEGMCRFGFGIKSCETPCLSMRVEGDVGGYISLLPQKTLDGMQTALPSLDG